MTLPTSDGVVDHLSALADAARLAIAAAPVVRLWGAELADLYSRDGRVLACGNGGSAAEPQHLTGELVGHFQHDRRPLSAIALHADTSAATAILNDYGPEELYARQVRAHGRPGDVLVALSTSGRSVNIVAAAKAAQEIGVRVWALTGPTPNPLASMSYSAIAVRACSLATVQEMHLSLLHALCLALDAALEVPT
jgi:D-sedoheptulose 7-phosphate isomerase